MIVHGEKSTSMGRRVDRLAKAVCILKELVGRGLKAMCLGVRRKKMGRVPNIAYVATLCYDPHLRFNLG